MKKKTNSSTTHTLISARIAVLITEFVISKFDDPEKLSNIEEALNDQDFRALLLKEIGPLFTKASIGAKIIKRPVDQGKVMGRFLYLDYDPESAGEIPQARNAFVNRILVPSPEKISLPRLISRLRERFEIRFDPSALESRMDEIENGYPESRPIISGKLFYNIRVAENGNDSAEKTAAIPLTFFDDPNNTAMTLREFLLCYMYEFSLKGGNTGIPKNITHVCTGTLIGKSQAIACTPVEGGLEISLVSAVRKIDDDHRLRCVLL